MHVCSAEDIDHIQLPTMKESLDTGEKYHQIESWPIIFPHKILSFLFNNGMHIPQQAIDDYWRLNNAYGEPWAQDASLHGMVPLGIFGDSAVIKKEFGSLSVIGVTLSVVLWRPRATRLSRFLLFSVPAEREWKKHTMRVVMRHLTWSLNACFEGTWPKNDAYGTPLVRAPEGLLVPEGGLRFVTTEIRGDWQWHKKVWNFWNTSWNALNVCHLCGTRAVAEDPGDLYWTLRNNTWYDNELDVQEFMDQKVPPKGICALDCFLARML